MTRETVGPLAKRTHMTSKSCPTDMRICSPDSSREPWSELVLILTGMGFNFNSGRFHHRLRDEVGIYLTYRLDAVRHVLAKIKCRRFLWSMFGCRTRYKGADVPVSLVIRFLCSPI